MLMLYDFLYVFFKDSEGVVCISWFFVGIIYNLLVFGEILFGISIFGIKFILWSEILIIF